MAHIHAATVAGALRSDARIHEAKKLILEALAEHQKKITGIKTADPKLKVPYETLIASFEEKRGGKLWFPFIGSGIGRGALVELLDGSVKYDFICGIGVHYWGHSHPNLITSSIDAAISDTIMEGNLQQNSDAIELVDLLTRSSKLDHCFLTSSGAMANENAFKIAMQKNHPATRILAFERGFAGRTMNLSQVTDKPAFREWLPLNLFVDYVPFYDETRPEESTAQAVEALKKYIARYPKQHALMIFELVQGEGGFYPGSKSFFEALMRILKENHIAILADEVQTFGRTSQLFAYQHFGLEEYVDIVTIGKLSQVCATLFRKEYNPRPGLLSQTYTGSVAAIHAAKEIIQGLLRDHFFGEKGKIVLMHNHFEEKLKAIAKKYPKLIKGPFGIGAMIAFTPYKGESEKASHLARALFDNGVMSFIAGANPTRIRMLIPAGVVTAQDINVVCDIIEKTLVENEKK